MFIDVVSFSLLQGIRGLRGEKGTAGDEGKEVSGVGFPLVI